MVDGVNPLGMSDDDFANMAMPESKPLVETPAVETAPVETGAAPVVEAPVTEEKPVDEKAPVEEAPAAESKPDGEADPESGVVSEEKEKEQEPAKPEGEKPEGTVPATGSKESEAAAEQPVDHKAFYELVMKPFQANGKTIELKSPEEAVQLMQQGANYTRKMQAIAPHRKVLTMLENNGLLSEDKLSFLIDIEKGNPDAVQKLLKEKGIDVMSIDTEADPKYVGGSHKVTDTDVAFSTNLTELSSTPEGEETLKVINAWDAASKEELWADPDLMPTIHKNRASGIYDRITAEVDRRRTLGKIAPEVPFIRAYAMVGDEMSKANAFDDLAKPKTTETPAPVAEKVPVATTAAKPKAVVENGDKVAAASTTKSNPKTAKALVNPLAMSDEEFEAQFSKLTGRV